jgi:amino-acid N-acetyltransferase
MSQIELFSVRAQPRDLDEVIELLAACDLPYQDLTPSHLASFQVVRQGNALVGVGALEPFGDSGLLRSLAIAPAYRGRKLGGDLVAKLESSARQAGISDLYLLTVTAQAFFAKRAYEEIARTHVPATIRASAEFVSLCPASAVCMRKQLT